MGGVQTLKKSAIVTLPLFRKRAHFLSNEWRVIRFLFRHITHPKKWFIRKNDENISISVNRAIIITLRGDGIAGRGDGKHTFSTVNIPISHGRRKKHSWIIYELFRPVKGLRKWNLIRKHARTETGRWSSRFDFAIKGKWQKKRHLSLFNQPDRKIDRQHQWQWRLGNI